MRKIIIELLSVLILTIFYGLIYMWRGDYFIVREFFENYCLYFLDRDICSAKESYEILIVMSFFMAKINFLIAIIMLLQNKIPRKQLAYNSILPIFFFTAYTAFEKTNSVRWVGLFILVYNWTCFRAMCYYIYETLTKFQEKQRAE